MKKIKIQIRQVVGSLFKLHWLIVTTPFSKKSRYKVGEAYQTLFYPFYGKNFIELNEILESEDLEVSIAPLKAKLHNVSEFELTAICSLIKDNAAKFIFEIGTYDGRTTRAMAMNIPQSGHVYTLNIPPETDRVELETSEVDIELSKKVVSGERYLNTPEANKISQLWGDSAQFDFSTHYNKIDVVFIDGAHSEPYVASDTMNAIKLIKEEGGIIIWHDSHLFGVKEYFRNHYKMMPVYFIRNTSLAVMKVKNWKPADFLK